jgi:hypothetical protein
MCRSIVLLGDQFPVPGQQGLRRDNAGDLSQNRPPQGIGSNGQSAAVFVIEAHSPAAELLSKNTILLAKVINDVQLALVHPAGDSDQKESEWVKGSLGLQKPIIASTGPAGGTIADSCRSSIRTIRGLIMAYTAAYRR